LEFRDYRREEVFRLLEPLSHNTSLEDVHISFDLNENEEWPSFDFLQKNTAIKYLGIWHSYGYPGRESFESLCRSLWTNRSLEYLDLGTSYLYGDDDVDVLVEMIRANASLREISLPTSCFTGPKLLSFVPVLAQSTTLECLKMESWQDGKATNNDMFQFVKLVLTESRLKELRVWLGRDLCESLAPTMAKNFHLEEFVDEGGLQFSTTYTTLNVVCKLNKFGRRYLVERGPECRVAGVGLLSAVSDDLDCLFYHLRENPDLCNREEGKAEETKSSRLISQNP
jgi:hypothetical protein